MGLKAKQTTTYLQILDEDPVAWDTQPQKRVLL